MSPTPNPLIAAYLSNANPAAPALGTNIAMPSSAPSMGSAVMPAVTPAPVPLTQTQTDINEYNRQKNTGDGISQIQNPLLRGIARAADIAGSVFAPNLAQFIPGTTLHHQLTMGQAANNVAKDQAEEQAQANLAGTQARTGLEVAQTDEANQGIAVGKTAAAKAAVAGNILYDENKNPIGYQDPTGRMMGVHDPSLPQNVQDILGSVKGKTPTSEFELWHQQNPNGTAADFNRLQSKPLSAQEATSLNSVWDNLATKHHLPTGQFSAGMPHADATQLASALNSAIGKQQGDVHVTIAQTAAQNAAAQKGPLDTSDPAMQASVHGVANGSMKLTDVFGRGATTAQKAQFVAAVKAVNPNYNSGDHDIENSVRRYMTSGQGGSTLSAGTTLNHHLDLYDKAVDAVHNGDVKVLNQIGNQMGVQMGNDAQTNLALIRQGVAMEAARFWTGGVPGEAEINQFNQNLSGDGSPKQMHGGANTVRFMAKGKLQGLQGQADAGATGQANFSGASGDSGGNTGGGSGMAVSLKDAMALPQFKGKSQSEVTAAIKAAGHEVRP